MWDGALNHVEPRIYDSYMGLKQSILSMFWDLGVQNVALFISFIARNTKSLKKLLEFVIWHVDEPHSRFWWV